MNPLPIGTTVSYPALEMITMEVETVAYNSPYNKHQWLRSCNNNNKIKISLTVSGNKTYNHIDR